MRRGLNSNTGQAPAEPPNIDLLFVGGLFRNSTTAEVIAESRTAVQFAADAMQWNLIKGFDCVLARPIRLLNAPPLGSYPFRSRVLFTPRGTWSHAPGATDLDVGYLNLYLLKHLLKGFALARDASMWARKPRQAQRVVVVYSADSAYLHAAAAIKKQDPQAHVCLILPDLPQFSDLSRRRSLLRRLVTRIDSRRVASLLPVVDSFVFLTEQMAERIPTAQRPWIVVEGIAGDMGGCEDFKHTSATETQVVLYTGTLAYAFGIGDLLSAFRLIERPDLQLCICGAGEAVPEIQRQARRDPRIRFLGQVPRSEALRLQQNASVLVNPRSASGEFTQFSFPSKTMEYLLSGTPAIAKRLPGIPPDYYDYLVVLDSDDPVELASAIKRVCEMPASERRTLGAAARNFVLREKSAPRQAARILAMVAKAVESI